MVRCEVCTGSTQCQPFWDAGGMGCSQMLQSALSLRKPFRHCTGIRADSRVSGKGSCSSRGRLLWPAASCLSRGLSCCTTTSCLCCCSWRQRRRACLSRAMATARARAAASGSGHFAGQGHPARGAVAALQYPADGACSAGLAVTTRLKRPSSESPEPDALASRLGWRRPGARPLLADRCCLCSCTRATCRLLGSTAGLRWCTTGAQALCCCCPGLRQLLEPPGCLGEDTSMWPRASCCGWD